MSLAAPLPATRHLAWADLGIALDSPYCSSCGRPDCGGHS